MMSPPTLPRPLAVIFDLDGTLADTFELIFASWNEAMRRPLGRQYSPAEIRARFGVPDTEMIRRELGEDLAHEEAVELYHWFYQARHGEMVTTFDGVPEMLDELARRHVPMGVFTGKGRRTMNITLEQLGLARYFAVAISGDDVERQKPAPDGLILAAGALDALPQSCVFVGDSPADINSGKSAGMLTVVAGWHPVYLERLRELNPDAWADRPGDVVSLFDRDQ